MKKRIFVLLLALVMVAGSALSAVAAEGDDVSGEPVASGEIAPNTAEADAPAPVAEAAALEGTSRIDGAGETISYQTWTGTALADATIEKSSAEKVESTGGVTWTGGATAADAKWYYVEGTVTIGGKLTVHGLVNLILCDGATLTVSSGIAIGSEDNPNSGLTIYGQQNQTGALTVNGGSINIKYSSLTVNGGVLTANGSNTGETCTAIQIAGANLKTSSSMTVNSGKVTATGQTASSSSRGIFLQSSWCTLTINGGEVEATGTKGTSGESHGVRNNNGGTVTITGGTLIAQGGPAVSMISSSTFTCPGTDYYWRTAGDASYKMQGAYDASALGGAYFELTTTKPSGPAIIEPDVTGATASVTYGDEPDGSVIEATTATAGRFAWKDVTGYGDVDTDPKTFTATFIPDDSAYASVDVDVAVTVAPKSLTVTASDHSITYGDEAANNGVSYDGFVPGEDASALGGTLVYDYNYSRYDDAGDYTITPKGLTSNNYNITFNPGTLTVEPKTIGIEWTDTELTHNGQPQKPTATATGLVNGDTCTITVTGEQTDAGTYTATAAALDNLNYQLPQTVTCEFTIAAAKTDDSASGSGSSTAGSKKSEQAPKTGDAGAAMYVVSVLGSMTGLVCLGRKKKR